MPRESFPEIIETKIYVSSVYPGNAAEDVEKLISKPLEEEFNNISGVTKVTSNTLQDYSMILVEFDEDISVEAAKQKVKDRVDLAKSDTQWPTVTGGAKVEPNVFDLNIAEEMPILNINLSGDFPAQKLKEYGEYLEEKIERLSQIKEVAIRGVQEKEVAISVDVYKMTASQVSFDDIINAVNYENKTVSGGNVSSAGIKKNIRVTGEIENPAELGNIIVKKQDGVVYLRDIATITFQEKERTSYAREFGADVVTLDVKKRSGKNMVEANASIKEIVETAKTSYFPDTLKVTYSNDQSVKTIAQVDDLVNNIIFGVLLVVVVLMFFLGFKNAFFVGFAIPLSMFMSYIILAAFGITLNTMVLFALVMGLGMLVDNGIVVVENVYSLINQGMSPKKAAIEGIGEIAWPIIASTATTLAAFIPLGLWPGTMGKFMIYFPMTLSIVLFSSLFVALVINSLLTAEFMKLNEKVISKKLLKIISFTLIGLGIVALVLGWTKQIDGLKGIGNLMLFSALMMWAYVYYIVKKSDHFQEVTLVKFENWYKRLLERVLFGKRPVYIVIGTFLLLIFSFVLVGIVQPKVLFFPENQPNQIMVYIEFPEGTDIATTNNFTKELEKKVYKVIEKYKDETGENYMVESGIAIVGEGAGNPQTEGAMQNEMPHRGRITLLMRDFKYRKGVNSSDVMTEIREAVKGYAGVSVVVEKEANGPPAGYPVNIEISGEDYNAMLLQAEKIKDFINEKNIQGIEELKIDVNKSKPSVEVVVDRIKAGQLGITSSQVGMTLRRAIFGEKISTYKEGKDDYEINVRFAEDYKNNYNALFNQPITFRDQSTGRLQQVPIAALATQKNASSFNTIKRKNLKRVITVYSNVLEGYNANLIVDQLKSELEGYQTPKDINYAFTGQQEEQAKNMGFLVYALLLAVASIVLILVAQFNSIIKPLIIMGAVILSFIGVFLGLVVFNDDFVIIMTMMGIISLAGIVVNNAIVLIDYTQLLIDRRIAELGLKKDAVLTKQDYFNAIVEGGRSRLRPVLLTAITTVLGLIPLAIGLNIDFFAMFINYNPNIYLGGDNVMFWGPLAKTVIYGLTFATFLTLVVVPVMFYMVCRLQIRFSKK
jgi:multidrug efflux pump subunit AcrB